MSTVYVFLADGFEEIEGLTVVDILRRAGVGVTTVSIMGRRMIEGAHKINVEADELIENTDPEAAELFVLPGGMPGTLHLRDCRALTDALLKRDAEKKPIAAICAAPTVFGGLGILKGKKAICYPGMEDGLTGAIVTREKVVTDGHITTSRGMGTAIPFALELTRILCGEEKAAQIGRSIVYGHTKDL